MLNVSLRDLLEAGCHFGHQVSRWNPKARDFIYMARDNIHVIDLVKTKAGLESAYEFLKNQAAEGKTIVFVGTKRQAKNILKEQAQRCGVYYICERWIGGLITNWEEVKKNLDKIKNLELMIKNENNIFTKAEVNKFQFELNRLLKFYEGIRNLTNVPQVVFILDVKKEDNCVREARKRNVPSIGIVDTNSDPASVDYCIPANDDAVGSIRFLLTIMADAVLEGKSVFEKKKVKEEARIEKEQQKAETRKAVKVKSNTKE